MLLTLAGITQQQVDAGVPLGTCLHLFRKWLNQLCEQHQLTFTTTRPGHLVTFATWTGESLIQWLYQHLPSVTLQGIIKYLPCFLLVTLPDFPKPSHSCFLIFLFTLRRQIGDQTNFSNAKTAAPAKIPENSFTSTSLPPRCFLCVNKVFKLRLEY